MLVCEKRQKLRIRRVSHESVQVRQLQGKILSRRKSQTNDWHYVSISILISFPFSQPFNFNSFALSLQSGGFVRSCSFAHQME